MSVAGAKSTAKTPAPQAGMAMAHGGDGDADVWMSAPYGEESLAITVAFPERPIYAGEALDCTITFERRARRRAVPAAGAADDGAAAGHHQHSIAGSVGGVTDSPGSLSGGHERQLSVQSTIMDAEGDGLLLDGRPLMQSPAQAYLETNSKARAAAAAAAAAGNSRARLQSSPVFLDAGMSTFQFPAKSSDDQTEATEPSTPPPPPAADVARDASPRASVPMQSPKRAINGAGTHARRPSNTVSVGLEPPVMLASPRRGSYRRHGSTVSLVQEDGGAGEAFAAMEQEPMAIVMSHAQIKGTFLVDEGLVETSSFVNIKKKAFVGGRMGGGVVDLGQKRSGLWAAFGDFGSSLFGGSSLSSLQEYQSTKSSKEIPVYSTSPTVLFVDAKLWPGDARTYQYSLKLPERLPPSYNGRLIKFKYSLRIGVQFESYDKTDTDSLQTVSLPFCVFAHVNANGQQAVYDLYEPVIQLEQIAKVTEVSPFSGPTTSEAAGARDNMTEQTFDNYVDALLQSCDEAADPTVADTAGDEKGSNPGTDSSEQRPGAGRRKSSSKTAVKRMPSPGLAGVAEEETPMDSATAINLALENLALYSGEGMKNGVELPPGHLTRYEIAFAGRSVCTVMLSKRAYRLGETLHGALDFRGKDVLSVFVYGSLETVESLDPSVSVRAPISVERASRRVFSQFQRYTKDVDELGFDYMIPVMGMPGFRTSRTEMHWQLRFDFVTADLPERARRGSGKGPIKNEGLGGVHDAGDPRDSAADVVLLTGTTEELARDSLEQARSPHAEQHGSFRPDGNADARYNGADGPWAGPGSAQTALAVDDATRPLEGQSFTVKIPILVYPSGQLGELFEDELLKVRILRP